MNRRLYLATLILISSMLNVVNAQQSTLLAPSAERLSLMSNLEYGKLQDSSDTLTFNYEKSPGAAFLMSAILPGTGELYSGAYKRGLAFLGAEAIFWGAYFNRKNKGEELETEYKAFADTNWDLSDYLQMYMDNEDYFSERESHHIYIYDNVNGTESPLNLTYLDTVELYLGRDVTSVAQLYNLVIDGEIVPVKDRDYYENIGKYDQFSGGWNDFNIEDSSSTSPVRYDYLTQRSESNSALKAATSFATAIMFNHLLSALHAQIAAKQYRSGKDMSWNFAIITDVRYKQVIRGVRLSYAF